MRKLKIGSLTLLLLFSLSDLWAFCGFYVAKADATLFNETSQVIIVRDGNSTVVTMSSDFTGDVRDFAMVIPVPEVLKKEQVRTVGKHIFTKADAYSSPRIVEYYDPQICPQEYAYDEVDWEIAEPMVEMVEEEAMDADMDFEEYRVEVVEEFQVDEYDVVILSAEESDGLERWLQDNGYNIPEGAQEVLEPYIKSDMKFFVVKVNLESQSPTLVLNPIQISYTSNNFMLPIRLGMANAKGDQDMLVYSFTRKGRVETTNYRTTQVPTDRDIPLFVQNRFGEFYTDLFAKSWKQKGKNTVWLEYAWDISASNPVKCDPCNAALFTYQELIDAGVFWIQNGGYSQYQGDLFMTRLHVRYNRETFPQDLAFQITPNTENFQARYVTRHPSPGPYECDEARNYLDKLKSRRRKEVRELAALTGWKTGQFSDYINEFNGKGPTRKTKPATGKVETLQNGEEIGVVPVEGVTLPGDLSSATAAIQQAPKDTFIPETIDKSEDPEYMTAEVESSNKKGWMLLPLIVLAIVGVLGLSRKKKTNL